jgi:hypothetical protein
MCLAGWADSDLGDWADLIGGCRWCGSGVIELCVDGLAIGRVMNMPSCVSP